MKRRRPHPHLLAHHHLLLLLLFLCSSLATSTGCERVNQTRARRLANQAVELIKAEQYSSAENLLKEALALYPHDANTRFLLGRVFMLRNQGPEAIQEFNRAIFIEASHDKAHFALGEIYYRNREYEKAANSYLKVIQYKTDHLYGYYHLGMCYHKLNRHQDAEKYLEIALKTNPKFTLAYNELAAVHYDQAKTQTDPAQATPYFEKAARVIQRAETAGIVDEQGYNLLGLVYQSQKRFDDAINAFNKAKAKNSYSAAAAYNLGATYDLWLEEFLNQLKEEKDKTKREQLEAQAKEKREKALHFFKDFLQLNTGDEGKRSEIREKIQKLNLMAEKELFEKLQKENKRKRRRRR